MALGAPHRPVSFTVPTGNFGNIFAGYAAKRMGLPIQRLIVATNVNDILHRTLQTGRYEVRGVTPTTSPSMDIQVSSNFERLLFELEDRDPAAVRRLMAGLSQSGAYTLDPTGPDERWRPTSPPARPTRRRPPRRSRASAGTTVFWSIRTRRSAWRSPTALSATTRR